MNTEKLMGIVMSLLGAVSVILLLGLTACSVKFEFGYHGQTGRDDRVQTELVGKKKQVTQAKY